MFRAQFGKFRLRPVGGAAAVVQVTGINKGTYTLIYHSVMSLLVIDFTFLDGRDDDIVVKELAAVVFQRHRFSSYIFKKPYDWEAVSMFTAQLNEAVAIYCYGPQKTKFISEIIQCTLIDMGQLGCPDLKDTRLPAIGCTFACHNKS
jgi:hypothetical protein